MKRTILFLLFLIFFCFLFLALRPISLHRADSLPLKGVVKTRQFDKTNHDLTITLHNEEKGFYINRALEKGLEIQTLLKKLENASIEIYYADHWTPLDPLNNFGFKHITQLSIGDSLVFSEFID